MTIQRQYNLPNCKLVLQGLSNDVADLSGRPLLPMVTHVECYLAGQSAALTGGKAFLDSLVVAVSNYAQSYLSGIQHLIRRDRQQQAGLVQIEQVGHNLHRLTVQPETEADRLSTVDLTTVQLFDLVEAIDQLFADAQTLPDLALKLDPISKRDVMSQEPIAKRAVPAAIGFASVAAAAAVLFMLPIPEIRRPEPSKETAAEQTAEPATNATPSGSSSTADADPASADSVQTAATASQAGQSVGIDVAEAPEITDPAELDRLNVALYDKLDLAWKKTPTFDGELIYRVGVNPDGEIVGYKFTNDAALTYLPDTPLSELQFARADADSATSSAEGTAEENTVEEPDGENSPAPENSPAAAEDTDGESSASSSTQPIGQFKVVFKSDGVLEVSPWKGQAEDESAQPATDTETGTFP